MINDINDTCNVMKIKQERRVRASFPVGLKTELRHEERMSK